MQVALRIASVQSTRESQYNEIILVTLHLLCRGTIAGYSHAGPSKSKQDESWTV